MKLITGLPSRVRVRHLSSALVASAFVFATIASPRLSGSSQTSACNDEKIDDPVCRAIRTGSPEPTNILRIRQRLTEELSGTLRAHLVVNGGHENPARPNVPGRVRFMAFESYEGPPDVKSGDLFIGYFLGPRTDRTLEVLPGFVELIAWDRTKQVYNFWELLDDRDWRFRGDSNDVLADITRVNIGAKPPGFPDQPRLRCSGCHTLGAPIMKEIEAPHNDWWTTARKLNLGPFTLGSGSNPMDATHVAATLFRNAADASNLSKGVKGGIDRLVAARAQAVPSGLTLKHQLRSLVATMEMNLVSDAAPLSDTSRTVVQIPQDFFIDARLTGDSLSVPVDKGIYRSALAKAGSRFAPGETPGLVESHHAFVVPARSHIDNSVIDALVMQGILDNELVADVLAIDFTTPVFSTTRQSLVAFLPERARDVADLRAQLVAALKTSSGQNPGVRDLVKNLTDQSRTADVHRKTARAYLAACVQAAREVDTLVDWLRIASQRRLELTAAETARHPEGNIKEFGFRLIFPSDQLNPRPGALTLNPTTCRAVQSS